ncbi:MAG: hypothetical protein KTR24_03065 [Saprospiraceae bacterium]|nr:hypothetical protein [Saprospiraceae bacterium]
MAVFTLPPAMMHLYKPHIEYLTEHAVDPDKRRYSTPHEAVRHYIDLDHFGELPYDHMPRVWSQALLEYAHVTLSNAEHDTLFIHCTSAPLTSPTSSPTIEARTALGETYSIRMSTYGSFFRNQILPDYYEDPWVVDCVQLDSLEIGLTGCWTAHVADSLSPFGILPYHLEKQQRDLTQAFVDLDKERILRLSAEMGHYLGDAHVPLHTTTNYNGQLTNQLGIHAFWESRIPELFAEASYNFLVGKAEYIAEPRDFFWDVVLTSHRLVDSVLSAERELSALFPEDQQYCFDDRNNITVRTECRAYAQAYRERMNGMVEARMRASILSIGSAWYTAWVDAGQPDLSHLHAGKSTSAEDKKLDEAYRQGQIKGRAHD